MNELQIIKIGGNVTDNPYALSKFLKSFSQTGGSRILVHGGGKEATRLSARLGIDTRMVNGRRVTDRDTLDVVTMVYAGLVNKRIVSLLQSFGTNAIGLTGADGDSIAATMRSKSPFDYGYVGDINPQSINTGFISSLLERDMIPVFCAINHDRNGMLLNCNADSVATALAIAFSKKCPTTLTFCFEKNGVLSDKDDEQSVIQTIDSVSFEYLKGKGIISEGMLPKVQNALEAIQQGVRKVTIKSWEHLNDTLGTSITL